MAYTDDQKATAVQALIDTGNLHAAGRTCGAAPNTVKRWATEAGHDPVALVAHAAAKTRAANEATRRKWEQLRTEMADRSGDLAARVLDLVAESIDELKPETAADVKHLATAAGILIDKAQLLAGLATSRTEATINDQRSVVDGARDQGRHLVAV